MQFDDVQKAKHYNTHPSGVEAIEIVRCLSFNMGNAFKYVWRAGEKSVEDTQKDLDKALYYLKDEAAHVPFEAVNMPCRDVKPLVERVVEADPSERGRALKAIYEAAFYGTEYRYEVAIASVAQLKNHVQVPA